MSRIDTPWRRIVFRTGRDQVLPSFAHQWCTILNPGTRVEWGHEVDDWDHPTSQTVICVWESSSADMQMLALARSGTAAGARTLYLNPGAPITTRSRIKFPGDKEGQHWEVVSEPAYNESPTGAVSNISTTLRRWEAKQ